MVSDDREKRNDDAKPEPEEGQAERQDDHGELRFEGPVSSDDDDFLYEDDEGRSGGGRTFLLTAIIAVAVVLIIAIALLLREDAGPEPTELAEHGITTESAQEPAGEPPAAPGDTPEAPADAAEDLPEQNLEFRSVPADEPPGTTAGAQQPAASEPAPGATTSPETAEAPARPERAEPAPEPAAPERGGAEDRTPQRVAQLARDGQVAAAARLGRRIAASGNPSHYTLQVLLACQPGNVRRAFETVRDDRMTVLPARYRGQDCYRVCWGSYADAASARAAAGSVPGHFDNEPVPRPWDDLLQ